MPKTKKQPVPDPTRGKTRLIWEPTYVWTTKFLNEHPELKVGAEIGVAGGQHIKAIMEETKVEKSMVLIHILLSLGICMDSLTLMQTMVDLMVSMKRSVIC